MPKNPLQVPGSPEWSAAMERIFEADPVQTMIAPDLACLRAKPVPLIVRLPYETTQGDTIDGGIVVQYFSGSGAHYVALLTFEDWGSERCPRYAVYRRLTDEQHTVVYGLAQDVDSVLRWPGFDAEGRAVTVSDPAAQQS